MALQTDYGVVAGVVQSVDLVNPSSGQGPHYHIWVATPAGLYDSTVHLKSLTEVKTEYRTRDPDPDLFSNVLSLPDGRTFGGSNNGSVFAGSVFNNLQIYQP